MRSQLRRRGGRRPDLDRDDSGRSAGGGAGVRLRVRAGGEAHAGGKEKGAHPFCQEGLAQTDLDPGIRTERLAARDKSIEDVAPKAMSLPGKVPQAYVSYPVAKRACVYRGMRWP